MNEAIPPKSASRHGRAKSLPPSGGRWHPASHGSRMTDEGAYRSQICILNGLLVGTPPHPPRCARHLPPEGGRLCRSPGKQFVLQSCSAPGSAKRNKSPGGRRQALASLTAALRASVFFPFYRTVAQISPLTVWMEHRSAPGAAPPAGRLTSPLTVWVS